MNIAHQLTFTRILLSPIFVLLYLYHDLLNLSLFATSAWLIILMIFSELTDLFDGFFARRLGHVTELGKVFDPMADSVARISMLLCFTQSPVEIPLIFVFLLIFRDSLISCLRTICALEGFTLAARFSGKVKAVIQAIAIFLTLTMLLLYSAKYIELETMQEIAAWACGIAAAYTMISLGEYIAANKQYILTALKK